MAQYQVDLRDIEFNLNEQLNISGRSKFGLDEGDIKSILTEHDKFVENEIFPTREPSDEEGVKLIDGKVQVSQCLKEVQKNYYENGWFALGFPEEIEGTPVPEALAVACISLATGANCAWMMYPGLSRAALNVLRLKGDDFMKNKIIPKVMSGEWGGTMCLTEAGAGSDVGALRSTATPIDGNKYKIKGVKIFISSGESDLYKNNIHLVLARTPGGEEGSKGISLFVVPRFKINDDGSLGDENDVVCTKVEHKMGIHASATCELTFGDKDNCEGWLIGDEFDGMATMFIMMNEARLYCGVQGEAQANLALAMTEKYVKERSQFGKEIIQHPDVKRMLMRMRAVSRGMRALCLYTADLFDEVEEKPEIDGIIGLLTPICKSYCSEQGFQVSVDALQAHGGYGYCTEYGIEQFVRDTKIATIYEGTNGIQAMDFVMRKILKDQGKSLGVLTKEIMKDLESLDDKNFAPEKEVFQKAMMSADGVFKEITKWAQQKEFDRILLYSTDILNLSSQLLMAWRLMQGASIALKNVSQASGEDKKYYESKIQDFKVYCHHYLSHNVSIGKTITNFKIDLNEVYA